MFRLAGHTTRLRSQTQKLEPPYLKVSIIHSGFDRVNLLFPNLRRFVWRRHFGTHPDGDQHGDRKQTETSVTEFCYERVNSSLDELINIKVTFSHTRTVQIAKSPKISQFLNLHDRCFGRHINAASQKANQQWFSETPRNTPHCLY